LLLIKSSLQAIDASPGYNERVVIGLQRIREARRNGNFSPVSDAMKRRRSFFIPDFLSLVKNARISLFAPSVIVNRFLPTAGATLTGIAAYFANDSNLQKIFTDCEPSSKIKDSCRLNLFAIQSAFGIIKKGNLEEYPYAFLWGLWAEFNCKI
jgi:hypothetical protein